ncbi:MAG: hypothetical protein JXQ83_10675 [Candidatus Glassbacteria bacterium]|nr:hypothetical protein [Candidatus Glassbacteria bacterium]
MNPPGSEQPAAFYAEVLRCNAERLRLGSEICNSCPLKPLCYHERYHWEEFRELDLLEIRNSCPIRGRIRHKSG